MGKPNILDKIKSIKHIEIIVAVIAVAVMLILYLSTLFGAKSEKTADSLERTDYCAATERSLAEAISAVQGAGKTKVMIGWESGVESVLAYVTNINGSSTSTYPQLVTENGVTKPIVLKEIYPKPIGVVIICEGGDNVQVKIEIINAVCVLLQVTPDKITILKMKK